MSNKFLLGISAAFFAVFALGIAAVMGITHLSDHTTISDVSPTIPTAAPSASSSAAGFSSGSQLLPGAPAAPTPVAVGIERSTTTPVTFSDINELAMAVKLGGQSAGPVGREVWAKETPVAEQLLKAPCDCDQRNWLNHYVNTGKEALSGSENYYQSVQLLATLRRGNDELSASQAAR